MPEADSPKPDANGGSGTPPADEIVTAPARSTALSEDWWAVICGGLILTAAFLTIYLAQPAPVTGDAQAANAEAADSAKSAVVNPLAGWFAKPAKWTDSPGQAFYRPAQSKQDKEVNTLRGIVGCFTVIGLIFGAVAWLRGQDLGQFFRAFVPIFALATFAYLLSAQSVVKQYNLEYALWALGLGLLISNTIGTPQWLRPGMQTEFYVKTGLVLLGAGVLLSRLLTLGLAGVFVAWVVTPVVLISTYLFGQYVLKMQSKSLNLVISADMSVCGVSAAIATAAACKAKKEELSLAIAMSLCFTVVMMVVLPFVAKAMGLGEIVGGAWLGGTIDATGAVTAAGESLGPTAFKVAGVVKMIQNILIGVTAFCVAVYWVTFVEPTADGGKPNAMEIWYRFPKFVLGFVAASIVFSCLHAWLDNGPDMVTAMIKGTTKVLRGWLFCLAFVCIGLETDVRQLMPQLRGGKPLILYLCGQSLNLVLTLFMAWLMFGVVFKDLIAEMFAK